MSLAKSLATGFFVLEIFVRLQVLTLRVLVGLLLCSLLLLNAGCNGNKQGDPGPYFDSKAYFAAELERLQTGDFTFHKTAFLQEGEQADSTYKPNWENEFSLFSKYDLDNPANYGRFDRDTTFVSEGEFSVNYRDISLDAQDGMLHISVDYKQGTVMEVRVEEEKKNSLYQSAKKLSYHGDGFQIEGSQKIRAGENMSYGVKARFIED